jgi:hypothetical protein
VSFRSAVAFGRLLPAALGLLAVAGLLAAAERDVPGTTQGGRVIAVFPTQNRAGDTSAAGTVEEALRVELGRLGRLVGPGETRDALRRLRIRNGDRAAPQLLRQLGDELDAGWLVSSTLHDADRLLVPSLTVSPGTRARREAL